MTDTRAIDFILEDEAGYNNDPNDGGGETYRGIARVYNPNWNGWTRIDELKKLNGGTLKRYALDALADLQARQFYLNWWKSYNIQYYPENLRYVIFDSIAMSGENTYGIIRWAYDGNYIHKTWNKAKGDDLFDKAKAITPEMFSAAREQYVKVISEPGTTNNVYRAWWIRRVHLALSRVGTGGGLILALLFFF